jgi:hypothetical protein
MRVSVAVAHHCCCACVNKALEDRAAPLVANAPKRCTNTHTCGHRALLTVVSQQVLLSILQAYAGTAYTAARCYEPCTHQIRYFVLSGVNLDSS